MPWTGEERAFAVESFLVNGYSVVAAQRAFRRRFQVPPRGAIPDRKSISLWVSNFRTNGELIKKGGGRPRSVRNPQNIDAVRRSVQQSPKRSAIKHARALHISDRSVRRILHQDLRFHPYKMVVVQQLSEQDHENRAIACANILENVPEDAVVFFSDESHFHLSGCVNHQNFRYWSGHNPRELHEKPLHDDRVTVWCAIGREGIIGPYFFEENGVTVTVNAQRYSHMINTFLSPRLNAMQIDQVWFQQDGATAHTARLSLQVLRQMFPGRLISSRGDVPWPARSPDIAPCDFFLWGYLKAEVYKHRPRTLPALRNAIQEEIDLIPQEMLVRVVQNFRGRIQQCINSGGHHLRDALFKK